MFEFIPPAYIKKIQREYSLTPDSISEEMYQEVRQKIKLQDSDNPLVSVVVIAYNEEDNLFKTIVSLSESQCRFPMELIIVNNNSTDRTQEIIERCGIRNVVESRQGYAYARQAGLNIARGKYVVTGDADTIYPHKWVELMIEPLEKDPEVVCTYGLHAFYTEDGRYPLSLLAYQKAKTLGVHFRHMQRPQLNTGGASMAYRMDTANKVGGYDLGRGRGEDGYLTYQMMEYGKVEMVRHKEAMIYTSMRRTQMDGSLAAAFWKRAKRYFRNAFKYLTPQKDG